MKFEFAFNRPTASIVIMGAFVFERNELCKDSCVQIVVKKSSSIPM